MDNWANTFIRLAFVVTFMSTGLIALPVLDKVNQGAAQEGVHPPLTGGDGEVSDDPNSLDTAKFIVGDVEFPLHRNAIRDRSKRWPGGIVPYVIDNDYPDTARLSILESLQEIESDVESNGTKCIQFIPRTTESNYLRIKRGTGCHSPIGDDPDEGTDVIISTLGPGCETKGVAMHEMLHVLGFYHEQNRPDRDLYVDINETNVGNVRDFYIRNDTVIDTLGLPYDFHSLMHYGSYNMATVKRYPVITPKPQFAKGLHLGQRIGLSELDVVKVQTLYGCPIDTGHIHWELNSRLIEGCDFYFGMCNFTYDAKSTETAKWTVQSGDKLDGPISGFGNGLDPYLYVSLEDVVIDTNITEGNVSVETVADDPQKNSSTGLPVTATIFSPLLTSPDDGKVCIQYVMFQKGPSSYIQLYVSGPLLPRTLLRNYMSVNQDFWARDEVKVDFGAKAEFRLEFVANLQDGPVAIDEYMTLKGNCIYNI
ncbi:Zinc metalloproteinase nas-15 [Bulinus truncatus]|nr:Zinc metalloproteinase nas-15 [Bulinus truncatus]